MELLLNYSFPGNIRELENIIERGVAMENTNIILPENLVLETSTTTDNRQNNDINITDSGIDLNEELEKVERKIVEKALEKTKGSKTKAAELLHITLDSLRYRIEKLDIE